MSRKSFPIFASVCSAFLFSISSCSRMPEAPPKTVHINADDQLKYDVTAFDAKPGQKISVTLTNVGVTPKFAAAHNFVVLDRNVNVKAFLNTASMNAANDYIPPEFEKRGIIAHTRLLGPGQSDTVTFNAPFIPGEYPFFCSFPGHYAQGSRGIMTVK